MQKQILQELKELKIAIAKVIGIPEMQAQESFSQEALNRAAKEFQKLSIERGEWIEDGRISGFIKDASYHAGAFIRREFGFSSYFKRGKTYYYNKKDLIELAKELKVRNVNLGRYIEFKEDQIKFEKYVAIANENSGGKRKRKHFKLADDLKDITTSPPKKPSNFVVKQVFFCGGDKSEFNRWKKGLDNIAKDKTKKKVEYTLKIEIDDEAFDSLYGHISHPIEIKKKGQKIAVRIISQFGEESTKVISIEKE